MVRNKACGGRALRIAMGITVLVLLMAGGAGAAPVEEWNRTFGGTYADGAKSVQQTKDGGYIIAGSADLSGRYAWLIKTDKNGSQQWSKTFGEGYGDYANSVQQASDGGYIFTGFTWHSVGWTDVLLIKTDANGSLQWKKTFGGTSYEEGRSVKQTSDGGYILAGVTRSFGAGNDDAWLIKTDSNGNLQWSKTFGGIGGDFANSVQQTSDGGYSFAGKTTSYAWLVKTDSNGNHQWNKSFLSGNSANSIQQTSDGGYILAGNNYYDAWLIKTDSDGNKQWENTFGGTYQDSFEHIRQTLDKGYILSGWTRLDGAGNNDAWLVKTDSNGNKLWEKTFGGTGWDEVYSVQQTSDGSFILAGDTDSYGAGNTDAWLIKVSSEKTRRIAFVSMRDGNEEIYVMNEDGSGQTRITHNTANDSYPYWSPDARKMTFSSNRDGDWDVYVMNADGSGQTDLTRNPANDGYAEWSPDGQRIVFVSDRDSPIPLIHDIYTMDVNGNNVIRLTDNSVENAHPAWSPDGQKIAFASDRDGYREIYIMNADGSGLSKITNTIEYDDYPTWSPDGTKIAFASSRDSHDSNKLDIYMMNANGANVIRLTNNIFDDRHPSWSPDDNKIAFASDRDGNREIYVMNADGTGITRLTNQAGDDQHPAFIGIVVTVCSSGCDYARIQDAINAASAEDTILVYSGTYFENVIVNKQLELHGQDNGGGAPVVDAGWIGNVISITANGVTLDGFGIKKSGGLGNAGIYVTSNENTIRNNNIFENFYGIYFSSSSNNTIVNNSINSNKERGIQLYYSNKNNLSGNIVSNNYNGIDLYISGNNSIIKNNVSSNAANGIMLYSSSNNTLTVNSVKQNEYGVRLDYSSKNTIYNNYFNNKNKNFYMSGSANIWNTTIQAGTNIIDGSYLGGNFWAFPNGTGYSKTCADNNGDGICDSPYILDSNNIDYLPLAYKFTSTPTANVSISGFSFQPQTITVAAGTTVTWTNLDSVLHTVTSDTGLFDSGSLSTGQTFSRTFDAAGNYDYHCSIHPFMTGLVNVIDTKPPVALASTNHTINNAGSKAFLNASASYDPDGSITAYNWSFGDGTNASGSTVSHTYSTYNWNGTAYLPFIALLTVTDNSGATNSTKLELKVFIAGDTNGDGKVNILDTAKIGLSWNSKYGDAKYDDGADLNNDNKVNILDMAIVGLNWNKKIQLEGTITLSGAWALYPMAVRWGEEFQKLHPKVKVEVSAGGSGKGMADAIGKLVDIGMVSRDIDSSEIEKGAFPIAVTKDGVVPTINAKNPVLSDILSKGIMRKTFVDIYIDGTVKTWGEAVGKPEIKDGIHVYTRSDAAGAPEIWAKYLGKKQENLKGTGVYGDPGLLAAVQKDPLGIGYNNYIYAFDMKTGQPVVGVQITPFDVNENGIVDPDEDISTKEKTIAAIKKGVFPHPPARVEYFVTKGKPAGLKAEFIKWTLTDGQEFVNEVGYIELSQEILNGELKKLD